MEQTGRTRFEHAPYLVLYLLTRIPLLWLNQAEHTDAYILFRWTFFGLSRWHPLYPLSIHALQTILDPIMAGRVISVAAGILSLHYLFLLTREIYGSTASKFTMVFFIFFPLGVWVQTRVLTESLFVFTCIAAIYSFLRVWKAEDRNAFFALVAFSALSALTRPEGVLSGILIASAAARLFKQRRFRDLFSSFPGWILWIGFFFWYAVRSKSPDTYGEVASTSLSTVTIARLLSYLTSYIDVYPYVFGYLTFGLAFVHLISPERRNRMWTAVLMGVTAVWFMMLATHWAWSSRFLVFPGTLLLVEAGAQMDRLRNKLRPAQFRSLLGLTVVSLVLLSSTSLYYQRELFADFKNVAEFIKVKRTNQRVFSDEIFKTSYYLNAPVLNYSRDADFQAGDIIALHSFHTDIRNELLALSRIHKLAFVYNAKASMIPLLANIPLARFSDTNSPTVLAERFNRQEFQSVAIQILEK